MVRFYKNPGYLAGFVSAVAFALVNIFTSTAMGSDLGPGLASNLFLVFFRSLFLLPISAVVCLLFYKRAFLEAKIIFKQGRADVFAGVAIVALSIILSQLLLIFSVVTLGSDEATYLFYAFPVFVPFLCYLFLKTRVYWYHLLIGALLVAFTTSLGNLHQLNPLLFSLPLMAALFFAVYIVLGEKVCHKIHPLSLSLLSSLLVFIFSLTTCFLFLTFHQSLTLLWSSFHLSTISVAAFGAIGYITGIIALRFIGSKMTALISTFVPAIVAAVTYFHSPGLINGDILALISIVPLLSIPLLANDLFFSRKKSFNTTRDERQQSKQLQPEKIALRLCVTSQKTYDDIKNPLSLALDSLGIEPSISINNTSGCQIVIGNISELFSVLDTHNSVPRYQGSYICVYKNNTDIDVAVKNQFSPIYAGVGSGLTFQTWQFKTLIRNHLWNKFIQTNIPLLNLAIDTPLLPPQHSDKPISTRYMYIVTVDMRGYTLFCEDKSPTEIYNFQYKFLGALTPPVREHNGFIVEFMGDGFVAAFDSTHNALLAVKEIFIALAKFNGEQNYQVKIGVGLDAGDAAISTLGEPNRWTLSLTSDAIITSASIESLSKLYSANILATEEFVANLSQDYQSSSQCQLLDAPKIKGRRHSIRLYKLDPSF